MFGSIGIPELIIVLAIFAFWVWTLVRIIRDERDTMRIVWFLIVFFTHFLGAIIYWIIRAASRRR